MQNDDKTLTPDELRAAQILKKRTDQLTPEDRTFLAAEIAKWQAENQ
jgi:hypothetical protein